MDFWVLTVIQDKLLPLHVQNHNWRVEWQALCYTPGSSSYIQYSACTPPRGWLNMWLIQHHESIELHRSCADLFKLQNQLCKTPEEVYNRYCQDGARAEWLCCCPADTLLVIVLHCAHTVWHSHFPLILSLWPSFKGKWFVSLSAELVHKQAEWHTPTQANLTFHFTVDETRITLDTQCGLTP